jgi:hypothetical protein
LVLWQVLRTSPSSWRSIRYTGLTRGFLVDPTDHNPNTPPPATPLVTGPTIRLPGHHAKINRAGYIRRRRGGRPRSTASP